MTDNSSCKAEHYYSATSKSDLLKVITDNICVPGFKDDNGRLDITDTEELIFITAVKPIHCPPSNSTWVYSELEENEKIRYYVEPVDFKTNIKPLIKSTFGH